MLRPVRSRINDPPPIASQLRFSEHYSPHPYIPLSSGTPHNAPVSLRASSLCMEPHAPAPDPASIRPASRDAALISFAVISARSAARPVPDCGLRLPAAGRSAAISNTPTRKNQSYSSPPPPPSNRRLTTRGTGSHPQNAPCRTDFARAVDSAPRTNPVIHRKPASPQPCHAKPYLQRPMPEHRQSTLLRFRLVHHAHHGQPYVGARDLVVETG